MALPVLLTGAALGGAGKIVLRALGIGVVSYVAALGMVEIAAGILKQAVISTLSGKVIGIIGLARIDEAISIQLMFINIRLGIAGLKRFKLL